MGIQLAECGGWEILTFPVRFLRQVPVARAEAVFFQPRLPRLQIRLLLQKPPLHLHHLLRNRDHLVMLRLEEDDEAKGELENL